MTHIKRYSGREGYIGHKFSSGDSPLHPVEGVSSTTWRSNCEVCGKEIIHHEKKAVTLCSKECREIQKDRKRKSRQLLKCKQIEAEQLEVQKFLETLLNLPREEQSDKLLRYDNGKWFHRLGWFDEMRRKTEIQFPANTVNRMTDNQSKSPVTDAVRAHPKPKRNWEKLQAIPPQPHRSGKNKKTPNVKDQFKLNI